MSLYNVHLNSNTLVPLGWKIDWKVFFSVWIYFRMNSQMIIHKHQKQNRFIMKDYRRLPNCCRVSGKREKWLLVHFLSSIIPDYRRKYKKFHTKRFEMGQFCCIHKFNWKTNAICRRNVSIIPATFAQFTAITLNRLLGNGVGVNNLINLS